MFVLRSETEGNGWTIGSLHNVRRLATGQMYSMLGDSSARFDHIRGWRTSWTRTACVAQQIREAFPWDTPPPYLIRDQDGAYGQSFRSTVTAMGVEEVVTAPRSPWQNPYVERLIGSVRRERLDHSIILNERHLRRILGSYLDYYHGSRTHLSIGKDTPDGRPVQPAGSGTVVSLPKVGGLHHRYERLAA